jgi:hypothetical protein
MYFISIYENRRMKLVEIVLKIGDDGRGRMIEGVNLRYIISTHVNKMIKWFYYHNERLVQYIQINYKNSWNS